MLLKSLSLLLVYPDGTFCRKREECTYHALLRLSLSLTHTHTHTHTHTFLSVCF